MTKTSIGILTGYALLHLIIILLVDWTLRHSFKKGRVYRYLRWLWIIVYVLLAAVPVAATFLPEEKGSLILERYGNIIVGYELYICGIFLLVSLVLRIAHLFSGKKKKKRRSKTPGRPYAMVLVFSVIIGALATTYGMHHALQPVVKETTANIRGKDGGQEKEIRIALIADLHLSVNSHVQTTRKLVRLINDAEPDVVVIAGDIFTSSYRALNSPAEHAKTLRKIKAPMGVYAVYGNHDVEEKLFSGFAVRPVSEAFRPKEMDKFYKACGFKMLADDVIEIADGSIQLAGRVDGSKAGDGTSNRKSVGELLRKTDSYRPVLVLEHEPEEYEDLAEAGADMVMSGHTHGGQIFPGNLYVRMVCPNGYGQKTIYGMETFVTYGTGTFGPPMRTATNSEVMIIDLKY